jgi:hypothetical protein
MSLVHDVFRWLTLAVVAALVLTLVPADGVPALEAADDPPELAACPPELVPEPPFTDLTGGVHDDAIACLVWWELIQGRTPTTFEPDAALTRGAAARMLDRLLTAAAIGDAPAGPEVRFSDLAGSDLDDLVARLAGFGVVQGFADGTFRPQTVIARDQLASLIARTLVAVFDRELPADPGRFNDVSGPPHAAAVEGLAALGVLLGRTDGTFRPAAATSRAQTASIFTRVAGLLVLDGILTPPIDEPTDPCDLPGAPVDDCVRINEIQVLGSHNSYKLLPPPLVLLLLGELDPVLASELEYEHVPLTEQFERQGIRQIELDVFADPEGGLFNRPLAWVVDGTLEGDETVPELDDPGFKVMHVQDVDFTTTCYTLIACLEEVRDFSDANPDHLPIHILIEGKTDEIPISQDDIPFTLPQPWVVPLPFTTELFADLDAEIRSVFDDDRLITPDDVRGAHATLEDAVLTDGWPSLGDARGKVMFLFNNGGSDRQLYLTGAPNLEGRVMFTTSSPGQPDAAFLQLPNPIGQQDAIIDAVSAGYLVRTRSDTPTVEARSGDTTRRDAAFTSGAQFVSTDYADTSPFSDYQVVLPGGGPGRCNPVNAPSACVDAALE